MPLESLSDYCAFRFAASSPWDVLPSRSRAHRLRFRLLRITYLIKLFCRVFGLLKTFMKGVRNRHYIVSNLPRVLEMAMLFYLRFAVLYLLTVIISTEPLAFPP